MAVGGGSHVAFFRINDGHTALLQADGTALGGAPTFADAAFVLKKDIANNIVVDTSKLAFDDSGVGTATYTHTNVTNDFWEWLETASPKSAAEAVSAPSELKDETGAKIGGASAASGVQYLTVYSGAVVGSERYTEMFICTVKLTSGGTDRSSDNWQKPSIEVTTVACKNASGFAVPQACFATSHYGTIDEADRTIGKDKYVRMRNLTKEA